MTKVIRIAKNATGRDFVVGDIHFKTIDLHRGLVSLGFDKTKDRLFAVGDVIDRGPGVLDGLKLLGEPWFFSVRGNHEQMLIDAYRQNPLARYSAHGAGWWSTIAEESKGMIINKLESLPIALEIETTQGIVGIIHADVPTGMSWGTFTDALDQPLIVSIALWGRDRLKKHHRAGVEGVWRVCSGHTWIPQPLRLGNYLALDCTGGGEGDLAIYCVQEDTIYVAGQPVNLERAHGIGQQMQGLEERLVKLDTLVQSGKLIESVVLARESKELVSMMSSAWISMQEEQVESQRLINALHGLSLRTGEARAEKIKELLSQAEGTQLAGLLRRLFADQ